jgi:hypothetical protein
MSKAPFRVWPIHHMGRTSAADRHFCEILDADCNVVSTTPRRKSERDARADGVKALAKAEDAANG